jgi:hypothetical protein
VTIRCALCKPLLVQKGAAGATLRDEGAESEEWTKWPRLISEHQILNAAQNSAGKLDICPLVLPERTSIAKSVNSFAMSSIDLRMVSIGTKME